MDLTIYFKNIVRNFSRYHKYTLGTELREKSREIVTLIIRANSTQDKLPVLFELRQRLEGRQAYFIKMDIQGFFYNINKEILYRIIEKRVKDEAILWLARILIFHDCTKSVVFRGKKSF